MKYPRIAALSLALALAGAAGLEAQSVESILRARERLELTEDQVARLDQIRAEAVEQRMADQAVLAELRSQLAAGQIRRSELMAAMEDRQAASRERAEARRAQVESILTEDQRAAVERMQPRARRARGDGVGRGRFGPGVGPRSRFAPSRPGFGPRARRFNGRR